METTWSIEAHGDPLGTLNKFVEHVWNEAHLDGMIVSEDVFVDGGPGFQVLERPEQFRQANPFRPAMRANIARYLPQILDQHPDATLGALLRPCEMRALHEMQRIRPDARPLLSERLLTICVDCLGTYSAGDVAWRSERKGSIDRLSKEALQFARLGGIATYRYRPACQVCQSPKASEADINFGLLGLPARQHILVETRQAETASRLHFDAFPVGHADPALAERREQVLGRISERNSLTRERIVQGLVGMLPASLEALAVQIDQCGDCQECLAACPICSVQPLARRAGEPFSRQELASWMVACAGCGMCEQACPKKLPLSAIFGVIHEQLMAHTELQ